MNNTDRTVTMNTIKSHIKIRINFNAEILKLVNSLRSDECEEGGDLNENLKDR